MTTTPSELRAIDPELTESWSAQMTPHVVGHFAPRTFDEYGLPKPQPFEVRCSKCGQAWRSTCTSGLVRQRIAEFSVRHFHADPLDAPKVERPGSLRRKAGPSGDY